MTENLFVEVTKETEEVVLNEVLDFLKGAFEHKSLPSAQEILKAARKYSPKAVFTHIAWGNVCDFCMVTMLIQSKDKFYKENPEYRFAYVANLDEPMFSELGDVCVRFTNDGMRRAG